MISNIYIENYAIIDKIRVRFQPGFNVITGETGAGKSIVIEALGLALGERANTDVIRVGAERAVVECEANVTGTHQEAVNHILEQEDIPQEYPIILRREIRETGRSRAFINDTPCTVNLLKSVGDLIVDMHGQHEHQSLLNADIHITFLDDYADHPHLLENVAQSYKEFHEIDNRFRQLHKKQRELSEKEDLYKFQLNEIKSANPKPGEIEELEQQRKILSNIQRIAELVQTLQQLMYEGEASVYDELVRANELLSELSEIDESVNPYQEECSSAAVTVKEIGNFLNHYSGSVDSDPGQLNQIEERIVALRKLMKKFGPSLDDVIAYQQKLELMLDEFESYDSEINLLTDKKQVVADQLSAACHALHTSREQAAEQFSRLTEDILHRLGMDQAKFHVGVEYQETEKSDISVDGIPVEADANGADHVEFYIITNPGEGEKPLAQIASGGEISRTMLAIKSVLAGKDGISTVIFDEIDIGISGRISRIVGEELRNLSEYHQVICITHLPQIASLGDIHYVVGKEMQDQRTATSIRELDHEERIREIATLVGGETISETTLNNARELLRKAQE